jgi:hypothetical protein
MKRKGDETVPWGVPQDSFAQELVVFPYGTFKMRFNKNDW